MSGEAEVTKESVVEQRQAEVSSDVEKVVDHLKNNRTTEREAGKIHEAARRSLHEHATAKNLNKD